MPRLENPPFPRGATFWNGDASSIDTTSPSGQQLEGTEWEFEDLNYAVTVGAAPMRSPATVKCRVVRNTSGVAILPKQLCTPDATGAGMNGANDPSCYLGRVAGLSGAQGDVAFPADEFLPAAGVAANDLFFVVVRGPATVTLDNTATPGIAVGDAINPSAVGGGQAGTAAKQAPLVDTASHNQQYLRGIVGRSLQSNNVASTALVIDVGSR